MGPGAGPPVPVRVTSVSTDSRSRRSTARDLALVAVFAGLLSALGAVPAFQPFPSISPITAQTLGVMLAGSILGARRGALAVLTFFVLVAAGLPLLSGGRGGMGALTGRSAGFFVGWVLGAWLIGYLVERRPPRWTLGWLVVADAVGGIGVVYLLGIPAMALIGGLPMVEALTLSVVFLPGDTVKVAVAAVVTRGVLRGYPGVVPARRPLLPAGTSS
jgi:biotin transport system substrate-specific component